MTADQGIAAAAPAAGPPGFRSLMAAVPRSVAVVTATDVGGAPHGFTCSSVCGVAVDPPTLLVCVRAESPTLGAMRRAGVFAVNLLCWHARGVAELFASGAPDRFDRVLWSPSAHTASPDLGSATHSVADCRIVRTVAVGDQIVVFGQVLDVRQTGNGEPSPLLYGFRRYSAWSQSDPTPER